MGMEKAGKGGGGREKQGTPGVRIERSIAESAMHEGREVQRRSISTDLLQEIRLLGLGDEVWNVEGVARQSRDAGRLQAGSRLFLSGHHDWPDWIPSSDDCWRLEEISTLEGHGTWCKTRLQPIGERSDAKANDASERRKETRRSHSHNEQGALDSDSNGNANSCNDQVFRLNPQ